ncbi:Protein GrpE [uncultured archaeon]|nr:Protein GrpE [uncultured archaeon]
MANENDERSVSSTMRAEESGNEEEDLATQLSLAEALANERLEQLMRCRADLDNVMKRAAKDKEDYIKYASEKLICKLLPVLDSLDQAAKHDEGVKVLSLQLQGILSSEGLMPIEAIGRRFDPYMHEALFQVKCEEQEEGTVAEEIQKGYTFNSRVIRFSKVAVTKR